MRLRRRAADVALAAVAVGLVLAGGTRVVHSARAVPTYGATPEGEPVLLANADGQNAYSAVVRYQGRATCTGVFVDTFGGEDAPEDAPAYVVTNGHCSDFPGANEVLATPRPVTRHSVVFNYFADTPQAHLTVPVRQTVYATMKGHDVAVVELAASRAELLAYGIRPWRPATTLPGPGEPVVVVGAPLQRDPSTAFLRLAACALQDNAPVVEEYIWHWYDLDRLGCRGIAPGSSGSPVISRVTGEVIGLLNTTTAGGRAPYTACALDHPCEPRGTADPLGRPETSYATPLVRLARCFDDGGRFDVGGEGCPLDPGEQVSVSPGQLGAQNPLLTTTPIGRPRTRWDVTVGGTFEYYRYKVVLVPQQECRDLRGYGPARRTSVEPVITDPLPQREGSYVLCVIGGPGPRWDAAWQSVVFPTVVKVRIDTVPPRIAPPLTIDEFDTGWTVRFLTQEPEVVGYLFKYGPPGQTRCTEPADYRSALIPFLSLPKSGRPYVFCALPFDAALNQAAVSERLLL